MEDIVIELTQSQILKDKAVKAVAGGLLSLAVTTLVDRGYDKVMVARRLKQALQS